MTVTLPETLQYGKVVGRFVLAVADVPEDPDSLPNAVPAVGTINFTSMNPLTKETAATPPTTVVRSVISAAIDDNGYIYNPKDPTGPRGIWLVAGPYKVAYSLNTGAIAGHDILVLPEHDDLTPLDLINALPPGGPVLTASQFSELSARMETLEVAGGGGASALDDLTDVDTTGATTGDSLTYNGTTWIADTPASAPDASTSTKGIVRLTNHLGGTATAPTVRSASTTQTGIVELATNTEATTGTDTARAVTPAGVKAAMATQPINAKTGAYTLIASDAGKMVKMTLTAAADLTVPANVFTAGQRVDIADRGSARVTVVAGSGMTVNPPAGGSLVMEGQYSAASLYFWSATEADLIGLVAAS